MRKTRKALNFDLDTKELKNHYPNGDYHKAYYDIRHFLESNGFEHRQGSGYISKEIMSQLELNRICEKMDETFEWLGKCITHIDGSSIDNNFDLSGHFKLQRDKFDTKSIDEEKSESEEYEEEISYSRRR